MGGKDPSGRGDMHIQLNFTNTNSVVDISQFLQVLMHIEICVTQVVCFIILRQCCQQGFNQKGVHVVLWMSTF